MIDPTERNLLLIEDLALLGTAFREMGRYGEARRCLRGAIEVARQLEGRPLPQAKALKNWAVLHQCTGVYDEAERLYREALDITARNIGSQTVDAATIHHKLADLESARGRFENRLAQAGNPSPDPRQTAGADDPCTLSGALELAENLDGLARVSESLPIYADVLRAHQRL